MIVRFYIKNFALIDEIEIKFKKGLNVLTGETGAGKSITIGALSFLLGDKFQEWMAKDRKKEVVVESSFLVPQKISQILKEKYNINPENSLLILRREGGSKRVLNYINNRSVTLSTLKEIGDLLVDIHGQHHHQLLLKQRFHREVLDNYGKHTELKKKLGNKLRTLRELEKKIFQLESDIKQKEQEKDFYEFQINELEKANLKENEYEDLKNERELLLSAEKRYNLSTNVLNIISQEENALTDRVALMKNCLLQLSSIDSSVSPYLSLLTKLEAELDDLWREIANYRNKIEFSPERIEEIEARLYQIERLTKKYNRSVKELINYKEELKKRLDSVHIDKQEVQRLKEEVEKLKQEVIKTAQELSQKRKETSKILKERIQKEFSLLGMEKAIFEISLKKRPDSEGLYVENDKRYKIDEEGLEDVSFLFSANPGINPRPLDYVASGGELSRIMLALKTTLLNEDVVPVLIFDEIDVGIGGKTAEIVGKELKNLSSKKQVMLITHLPQIAKFADEHIKVSKVIEKEKTSILINHLSLDERIKELARMLGGEKITPTTLKHAKELLGYEGEF